ncbi:Alpha/Beta hydrolase protein [Apiosordaria backusii]|uniref:Alpha/Beta hydrolase protein n=1 Tax=Apiosordaria backusii TaxID=314023 RepID=A0AA40DNS4_9PEZI|nr:Alpha/Beta hydrolase protein [Apiosordaria backusii]
MALGITRYEGESLTWKPCPVSPTIDGDDHQLECSHLLVPMDQFNASNNGINNEKHFNISIIRLRGKNATVNGNINILLNPGGPGGSGTDLVYHFGLHINSIMGENFNLLSFDPRGVNSSSPYVKCHPTPEDKALAGQNSRSRSNRSNPYNLTESSAAYWLSSLTYTQTCKDTMGEHGEYINTPQTAADMNSILDAVGQSDLYYWGFSYGTILGQTYATMYPERSRRVAIDGVSNQFAWYTSFTNAESHDDTDKVFFGFVDECIKAGNDSYKPAAVDINDTLSGVVRFPNVWYTIFKALYSPAVWPTLATALAPLVQGNATEFFLTYSLGSETKPFNDYDESAANDFVRYNDGVSGPARSPSSRSELISQILAATNNTIFGQMGWRSYFDRRAWPIPQTHSFVPQRGVRTAHPLLVLSTTYDPVCPLISARSANDAFEGSRLVEIMGYGHTSMAVPSACVEEHVRRFFVEGVLPESNVVCEPDLPLPYFPAPGNSSEEAMSPVNSTVHVRQPWSWFMRP